MLEPAFSPYRTMFSTLPNTNLKSVGKSIFSSANSYNLDKSKNLLFVKS